MFIKSMICCSAGSSPQMRGARILCCLHIRRIRIIPADAGSTQLKPVVQSVSGDHPRRCGEHLDQGGLHSPAEGSSPQMRGARAIRARSRFSVWIIPADAGSTWAASSRALKTGDHPRRCGEHGARAGTCRTWGGSSPQMRGALFLKFCNAFQIRIIPADAGST